MTNLTNSAFGAKLTVLFVSPYTTRSFLPNGQVAQLVERGPEKAGVGGSIPSLATTGMGKRAKGNGKNGDAFPRSPLLSSLFLPSPIVLDSLLEQRKGNVVGGPAGAAQFFDHSHCAVGIARVHDYGGSSLEIRV